MEGRVFISYAREDGPFARRLGEDLRAAGIDVWLDQTHIRTGQLWDQTVEKALASSAAVIVVLTPAAVASRSVLDEVSYALEENKTVAPVLYKECSIPFRLRRLHYTDFTLDYKVGFGELSRALTSLSGDDGLQGPITNTRLESTSIVGDTIQNADWEKQARSLAAQRKITGTINFIRKSGLAAENLVESWSYPSAADWEKQARSLAAQGQIIDAIKLVREKTGIGVQAAKDLVETWSYPDSADWEKQARSLAAQGQIIYAIKLVRERTGLGLKEAKDLVESW